MTIKSDELCETSDARVQGVIQYNWQVTSAEFSPLVSSIVKIKATQVSGIIILIISFIESLGKVHEYLFLSRTLIFPLLTFSIM